MIDKPTLRAVGQGPPPDPFDLNNLRLSQNFVDTAGVKKLLTTVPVRKPNQQDFVRVHPSPDYRMNAPVLELKSEREEYIVARELLPELAGEFACKTLFTAINRQRVVFLWPVRLPDPDGRPMEWWRKSTCHMHCCGADTWRRLPSWNLMAHRSTWTCWRSCVPAGPISRIN
jgi:hypothetical protein